MAGTLSPILDGIVALLEGAAGVSPRVIPVGRFVHGDSRSDTHRPFVQTQRPRPFAFGYPRLAATAGARGDATGGSYARVVHDVELFVFYGSVDRDQLVQLQDMADDESLITHTLEYELNVATVDGWEGLVVLDASPQDLAVEGGVDGQSPYKMLRLALQIAHREETTP